MTMMFLIMGRTGSGKDTLANILAEKGWTGVKSYTTRPKRHEDEDTHIFITAEEATTYTDKVATTTINGYEYFATASQVENASYYIIDPRGADELVENLPNTLFGLVYLICDKETRRSRALARAGNALDADVIFEQRDADESAQFDVMEQYFNGGSVPSESFMRKDNFIYTYHIDNGVAPFRSLDDSAMQIMHTRN